MTLDDADLGLPPLVPRHLRFANWWEAQDALLRTFRMNQWGEENDYMSAREDPPAMLYINPEAGAATILRQVSQVASAYHSTYRQRPDNTPPYHPEGATPRHKTPMMREGTTLYRQGGLGWFWHTVTPIERRTGPIIGPVAPAPAAKVSPQPGRTPSEGDEPRKPGDSRKPKGRGRGRG